MKRFYTHLVEIESITIELDSMNLEEHQKHELAQLLDSNIHNVIMDAILSKLSDADKREFALLANAKNHQKVWKFLKDKSEDIENEIKKAATQIKKELHEDIKEAKRRHSLK